MGYIEREILGMERCLRLEFRKIMFNILIGHFAVRAKSIPTKLASVANLGHLVTLAVAWMVL